MCGNAFRQYAMAGGGQHYTTAFGAFGDNEIDDYCIIGERADI